MNKDRSSDVDMSMNNVEGEGEADDGQGERGNEGKEGNEMKVKVKKKTPQEIKVENRAKFKLAAAALLANSRMSARLPWLTILATPACGTAWCIAKNVQSFRNAI